MSRVLVVYSGGMDSFTLLHLAATLHGRDSVIALSVDYGQRHRRELDCAVAVTKALGIPHRVASLPLLGRLLSGSALTDCDVAVPEGHYAEPSMRRTVVPNRNAILVNIAVGVAISEDCELLWLGAHAGDHAIYPDCRPEFVAAANDLAATANYADQRVVIEAPFLHTDKRGILGLGLSLGLDYSHTWTCYKGEEQACGVCGSCVERLEAFAHHSVADPVEYRK